MQFETRFQLHTKRNGNNGISQLAPSRKYIRFLAVLECYSTWKEQQKGQECQLRSCTRCNNDYLWLTEYGERGLHFVSFILRNRTFAIHHGKQIV